MTRTTKFKVGPVAAQLRMISETTKTRVLVPVKVYLKNTSGSLYGQGTSEVMLPWGLAYRTGDNEKDIEDDLVGQDGLPFHRGALDAMYYRKRDVLRKAEERSKNSRKRGI